VAGLSKLHAGPQPQNPVSGVGPEEATRLRCAGYNPEATIHDNGIGIQKENLARVFEPFFTSKGKLGTGIGLRVTKQLIERRGGQITLTSSTASGDSGTTVTVFYPIRTQCFILGSCRPSAS
jgi:nitrogen fixation/metabolism regulation signal transduction histidine kinase